ncbi:hypothetical protein B566_EDAN015767 [Ephemera danica]|nr:hypothetical protein B566_EDAN015767 [Ephemera danica]
MGDEAEDHQNAWHDDFTTASQWEIFIARLEESIYDWKLPQFKPKLCDSQFIYSVKGSLVKEETNLFFSDVEFVLSHYRRVFEDGSQEEDSAESPVSENEEESWGKGLMETDILDDTGDGHGDPPHPIERWFGVHHFLVLSPAKASSVITSESQAKLLLSSVQVAINNSRCPTPIFVQLQQIKQFYFIGSWEGPGVKTEFNMVHLRHVPRHCRYLTGTEGLLDVFKGKLASATTSPSHSLVSPVQVSAQLKFCLKDWPMSTWTQSPPDMDLLHGQVGVEHIGQLPFGAESDPIREIHLMAQWRSLPESVLVDRDGYSDLAPALASRWSLRAILAPPRQGLLTKALSRILDLCTSSATLFQLLGDICNPNSAAGKFTAPPKNFRINACLPDSNIAESLSLLTEPRVPSLSKLVPRSRKPKVSSARSGPISGAMLMNILYFLFPDAEDDNQRGSAHMKSAPCDSLVWRLAVVMALVVDANHGGLRSGAHLWYEVSQEMRFRWEHAHPIPG